MALIDVDTRMFDPARRPDALTDAAKVALGTDELTEEQEGLVAGVAEFLDAVFPTAPEDVADFHAAVATYLSMVVISLGHATVRIARLEDRVTALED